MPFFKIFQILKFASANVCSCVALPASFRSFVLFIECELLELGKSVWRCVWVPFHPSSSCREELVGSPLFYDGGAFHI